MAEKIKAALMGGSGYAAAELIKRLRNHPHVELVRVSSIDHVGKNVGQVHKCFGDRLPYILEDISPKELVAGCDLVFLAIPHKVSYLKVPELLELGVKVIDYSGDYRIRDVAVYEQYYKTTHTNPENLEKFVYGLPELFKNEIKEANYIANPGCFPTSVSLGLLPLAKNGLLKGKVRVIGPTGSSGSGVHASAGTHHPIRSRNLKSYKPLFHQHQPEMEQVLRSAGGENISVDFIPISAPLTRGILTNSIVDLPSSITDADIQKIYTDYYKDEPFIRLVSPNGLPETVNVAGTNFVEIGWSLKEEQCGSKSFAAVCAIDNLVKGATGQAIQNMNLMYGFDELAGLDDFGTWP
ncbi:MAG: N-acetyl-gamma-glutamyl-phosphate reductase [Bacteriovoracaceae bacterium]|jgi:LysW-gamma-L-alpha-aminoadipyl-6-phosphate/LysW-L-glutamyl-5-phosphate reductase|nr:N-acetyl-gamma-glutamyl-phosphate reductase [Bacteriovoracaceae bacterium]